MPGGIASIPLSTTALCLHLLRRIGITHVLNCAWGKQRNFGMVNTSASYYRSSGIEFLGIEALDVAVYPLFQHFYSASEFIERALNEGGKVLVHCGEGISRSSTLVIAYLMIKRSFRVQDAVRQVVKHRNILPNQGFLLQLCQLHDTLQGLPSPVPPPSTSPPVRSSVSPMSERASSVAPHRPTAHFIDPSPVSNTHRYDNYPRASSSIRDTCPSPTPSRVYSNGWAPPPRCSSPSRSYASPTSSLSSSSKYVPKSSYLSSSTSLRSRRCQSVDREYTSSAYGRSSLYGTSRLHSNSLMSSYLSRPVYLAGIR